MKKTYKVLSILLMVLMVIFVLASTVFAATIKPSDITASSTSADTEIQQLGGKVLSVVSTIGIVLSVIMLAIIGISYMLSSSEGKAEYKKNLMPYIVGCVLVFGASTIANMVYNFAK